MFFIHFQSDLLTVFVDLSLNSNNPKKQYGYFYTVAVGKKQTPEAQKTDESIEDKQERSS